MAIRRTKQKKITGKIDLENFNEALSDIQTDSLIDMEKVADLLKECMRQAYLTWSYPGVFSSKENKNAPERTLIKASVEFGKKRFKIFDYKTVTNEDDIVDDAYQISLEDAQEIKPTAKIGDEIKIPFDVTTLDKNFVRRVKQLFLARIREASKSSILSLYQSKIKGLIQGTVTRVDGNEYELNFGKAIGRLREKNCLPDDNFRVNDRVYVYLSNLSDKTTPPTLIINRTSSDFVLALLKERIPEIGSGIIKVRGISRQAGKRTKVFVESTLPNVDPIGACVGSDASRMRSIIYELKGEKVDILRYYENKALQIIEAMKPATVIGMTNNEDFFDPNVHFEEIERDKDYEYPEVTVIVQNGSQGIAIGSSGANVRLASRITHTSINIKQADDAIKDDNDYIMLPQIEKLTQTQIEPQVNIMSEEELTQEQDIEIDEEISNVKDEEIKPITSEKREIVDLDKLAIEEKKKEEQEKQKLAEKQKKEIEENEHIEIKNKPKIKLEDIESALEPKKHTEVKKTQSHKAKKEEVVEEKVESPVSKVEAMPIYTEDEIASFENDEDKEYEEDDDSYIDEEYEDYQ